jgi:hypothetical protein
MPALADELTESAVVTSDGWLAARAAPAAVTSSRPAPARTTTTARSTGVRRCACARARHADGLCSRSPDLFGLG